MSPTRFTRSLLIGSALVASLGFSACTSLNTAQAQTPAVQANTVTSNAQTRADLYAFNDRFNAIAADYDLDAFLSLYAPDALWIAPSERPVAGYAEPTKTFTFLSSNKGTLTHTVDHLHISDDGTQATMIGGAVIKVEAAGLDATGTYLFVLKRQGNDWKIVTDMFHQHTKP